jgi:hypothetical protein
VVNGQASLSVMLGVGNHSLSATYSGGESNVYNQVVTKAAPAFSLVSVHDGRPAGHVHGAGVVARASRTCRAHG